MSVKFYTDDGNCDLVSNNIPVFFLQDAMKFPDLMHSSQPDPRTDLRSGDRFFDFLSLHTETAHAFMWIMTGRALPRSWSMMAAYGIHTFRFINEHGQSHYVKFIWRPVLGINSLVSDEAQILTGRDGDFHRRQLYEAIDKGQFPTWELAVQIFTDKDADTFDFDILDSTKLIPEELVPERRIGRLVLNRNPDNFFAETEQVAFCVSHIVPGLDFTNDPLLHGRLFSYLDTQLTRLGGPNFHEIPINRPKCAVSNNQRDGMHRMTINVDTATYSRNSIGGGWPRPLTVEEGGFASYPDRVSGVKLRGVSAAFSEHFSQATLVWNSLSKIEQEQAIVEITGVLSSVSPGVRDQIISNLLVNIDDVLTSRVLANLGLKKPKGGRRQKRAVDNDNEYDVIAENLNDQQIYDTSSVATGQRKRRVLVSPRLSQLNAKNRGPLGDLSHRKIAILAQDGVGAKEIESMTRALLAARALQVVVVYDELQALQGVGAGRGATFASTASVIFDGVIVASGAESVGASNKKPSSATRFVQEAYGHGKAIAAIGDGLKVLDAAGIQQNDVQGVFVGDEAESVISQFIDAVSMPRFFNRPTA